MEEPVQKDHGGVAMRQPVDAFEHAAAERCVSSERGV